MVPIGDAAALAADEPHAAVLGGDYRQDVGQLVAQAVGGAVAGAYALGAFLFELVSLDVQRP